MGLRSCFSLYKGYGKAVALKRDDPALFAQILQQMNEQAEKDGQPIDPSLDDESRVASFLR